MLNFIYNPTAGKGKAQRFRVSIEEKLKEAGVAYSFWETTQTHDATRIAKMLTQKGEKDIIAMAQRQLVKICDSEEMENTLEGILRLRGYEDCVVTVHNDCVNVMVLTDIITQQDSSLILDHVCRESGVLSGNVKIIPIK